MATLLKERSTYWVLSGGSNPATSDYGDYRCYWKIYYEQSDADKKLLRTKLIVDYYFQSRLGGDSYGAYPSYTSNCLINGSSIGSISKSEGRYTSSGLTKIGSKTTYIKHNADGTASFTFQGKGFGKNTAVSTYSLPKISVGTEITNNSSSSNYINLDSNVTFTLNDLTGQVEANRLYYKIESTEYEIVASTTDTTVNYAFPVDIITNYPNNANISLTVYCKNLVSNVETSTTVYLKLPDSYVPSASLAIADVMSNKPSVLNGLWIKNQSQLKGTITASGVKGSSIKSYLSSISGFSQQYSINPFTTQALTVAGSRTVSATVTDSRDRKKTITQNINVIDYAKPTITSLVVKRCLQDGTLSESGTYAKVICKYSISPINNLNTKTLKFYLNGKYEDVNTLSSYSGEFLKVVYANIKQDQSYTIKAVLSDLFGDVPQEFLLGVAYKTVSKRAGGKGITFGGVATQDGFHNYMPSRFYEGLQVDGDLTAEINATLNATNSIVETLTRGHVKFLYNVRNGTDYLFDVTNNANAIMHISKHDGAYDSQLGFSSNGRIYYKSANARTLDSVSWKTIAFSEDLPHEVILYDNETGASGTITLSDSSANYKYLEIFYRDNNSNYNSVKVYSPNGKIISLQSAEISTSYTYMKFSKYTISANTITENSGSQVRSTNGGDASVRTQSATVHYITRVVGYK